MKGIFLNNDFTKRKFDMNEGYGGIDANETSGIDGGQSMLTPHWSDCSYWNNPEEPCDCGGTGIKAAAGWPGEKEIIRPTGGD